MTYSKLFMKNILIFATVASVAIVIAYYVVIEKLSYSDDVAVSQV
jgi:hypothetical protein